MLAGVTKSIMAVPSWGANLISFNLRQGKAPGKGNFRDLSQSRL